MDFYLAKINDSNKSIQSLEFRKPGIFTNAVILKPSITSLIQDADAQEHGLFHISSKSNQPVRSSHNQSARLPADITSIPDLSIDALCTAAEQLARIYPIDGLDSRIAYYRSKSNQLNETIFRHEDLVETQRRQLVKLNDSVESRLIPQNTHQDSKSVNDQIARLKEEVRALESEFSVREREVQNLEGKLMS